MTVAEVDPPDVVPKEKSAAVPVRESTWGESRALSVSVKLPEKLPAAEGVKVRVMVHVPPGAKFAPHVFVCPKVPVDPVFVPAVMLAKARGMFPVFVRVIPGAVPVAPTRTGPSKTGERFMETIDCAVTTS